MKKIISMVLAACMLLGCAGSLAENTKHERVYVVMDAEGAVKSITDNIRLENEEELDELVDATMLTELINVGGKETFTLDGETLTWQAGGKDINYQGTSDKTPALLPVVTLTLDGETISAADLKEKTGEVTLTVTYQQTEEIPTLAVSAILLPEEGVTDLKLENAAVLKEMGRQVLVGWAVPGASKELELPSSFSAAFQADHADLSWMMTFTTSDPVKAVTEEIEDRVELDAHLELDEAKALLTAMKNGETLPETTGKTKDIGGKVNELNDGLKELNEGAVELADGAKTLSDGASDLNDGAKTLAAGLDVANNGAASLEDGLNTLIESNDALNQGAQSIFAAILATANQQIAASGLDAAGISLPELTAENYADILDGLLAKLSPDTMPAAYESLSGLKMQLDQINTFVTGVQAYTSGAKQAADGAAAVHTGLTKLNEGGATLQEGAAALMEGSSSLADGAKTLQETGTQKLMDTLMDAEKEAAEKLLPYVEDDLTKVLRIYEETRDNAENSGYDLRPEGMKTVTVYIIRSDLQ